MPRDELVVKIGGDTEGLQKAAREGKAELDRFKQSSKEAAKVIESIKTPTEKYADEQRKLNGLLREGKITQDQHAAASKKNREELKGTAKAFDTTTLGIGAFTVGISAAASAMGLLRTGLKGFQADAARGIKGIESTADTRAALAQLSDGSKEKFNQYINAANNVAITTGISEAEAQRFVFNAESAEVFNGGDQQFLDLVSAIPLLGSESVTKSQKLRKMFAGRDNISAMGANAMVLQGARFSDLDASQLTPAVVQGGETAGMQGTGVEELIATIARLQSTDFENAGDRVKAFQSKIALKGGDAAGKGILDAVKILEAMPAEARAEILGDSQEVNAVYTNVLKEMEAIRSGISSIREQRALTAAGGGRLLGSIGVLDSDANTMALREQRKAANQRDIDEQDKARMMLQQETAFDKLRSQNAENGFVDFSLGVAEQVGALGKVDTAQRMAPGFSTAIESQNPLLAAFARWMSSGPSLAQEETRAQAIEARRQTELLERIAGSVENAEQPTPVDL